MADSEAELSPFNLETMSGVFPGTRPQVFQRLRLRQMPGDTLGWYLLVWYVEPVAHALFRYDPQSGRPDGPPILSLGEQDLGGLHVALDRAAAGIGLELQVCGTCRWWARTTWTSPDGLAAGRCGWHAGDEVPLDLAGQSSLALRCHHWELQSGAQAGAENSGAETARGGPLPPLAKSAELDADRLPRLRRWLNRLRGWVRWPQRGVVGEAAILERSGVGAGTEPCFACQGRIANLGALTVESPDGDKETLSVWRCRSCYTTYLNDWIDRWERLDSLETEETYYRIAPGEAHRILSIIGGIQGADHPAGRSQRHDHRKRVLDLVRDVLPLSHQIKQGR